MCIVMLTVSIRSISTQFFRYHHKNNFYHITFVYSYVFNKFLSPKQFQSNSYQIRAFDEITKRSTHQKCESVFI